MNKELVITFRVSRWEKNRIKGLARDYAQGDISLWIRHAVLNGERKYLTPKRKKAPQNKSRVPQKKSNSGRSAR